jgi:hypothetical protein
LKTLSSKYTLLALVALLLGLGLLLAAPVQAGIVWTDMTASPIHIPNSPVDLEADPIVLPPGYDLDIHNDGIIEFNINVFNTSLIGTAFIPDLPLVGDVWVPTMFMVKPPAWQTPTLRIQLILSSVMNFTKS